MHKQTPADYRKLSSKLTKRGKIERNIPQIALGVIWGKHR